MWAETSDLNNFDKVAILGTGLMGGSLGMALKEKGLAREIWGYSRKEFSLNEAEVRGAIDFGSSNLEEVVRGAELVVLAVPVKHCEELLARCACFLSSGALVTDVGSTKKYLTEKLPSLLPDHTYYIGGHPMAGSEESGIKAADPALWENAIYVLTPYKETPDYYIKKLRLMVEAIGAQPLLLSPEEHDRIVALVSHLPHIVAAALVEAAASEEEDELIKTLAAGGFRDTTRIAMGNPEVWKDICVTNAEAIVYSLEKTIHVMEKIRKAIICSSEDYLVNFLQEARNFRQSIPYRARSVFPEIFDLVVLVKDTPGMIGCLAGTLGREEINIAEIEILHVREEEGGSIRIGFRTESQRIKARALLQKEGYRVYLR